MPKEKSQSRQSQYRRISPETFTEAIKQVKNGLSLSKCSQLYNIPKSTLYSKVHNMTSISATKGPSTVLTAEEEIRLVNWIFYSNDCGFPISRNHLSYSVKLLIEKQERENPFKDNRPGRHWYESFIRRHPELTNQMAQNLTASKLSARPENLRGWFKKVSKYLKDRNLLNINPSRCFNCDESDFVLCPKLNDFSIVRRGSKSFSNTVKTNKSSITSLLLVNAAGEFGPPLVILSFKRKIPIETVKSMDPDWGLGRSDTGYMTPETFFEYVKNIWHPSLVKNQVEFPVVLFLDGNSPYLTLSLSEFCRENQIVLIGLCPNAAQILQPIDVAVFQQLKIEWKKTVLEYRLNNNGIRISRETFCPLLKSALSSIEKETIANAFKTCGLYPFAVDNVDLRILNKRNRYDSIKYEMDDNDNDDEHLRGNESLEDDEKMNESAESEANKFLRRFEEELGADTLQEFRSSLNQRIWNGEVTKQGLFDFWLKLVNKADNEYII